MYANSSAQKVHNNKLPCLHVRSCNDSQAYAHIYTYLDMEVAYVVVSKHLLLSEGDSKRAVLDTPRLWPVVVTLDVVTLLQVGHHDDRPHSLLPHGTPEVNHCLRQRTWSWGMGRGRERGRELVIRGREGEGEMKVPEVMLVRIHHSVFQDSLILYVTLTSDILLLFRKALQGKWWNSSH